MATLDEIKERLNRLEVDNNNLRLANEKLVSENENLRKQLGIRKFLTPATPMDSSSPTNPGERKPLPRSSSPASKTFQRLSEYLAKMASSSVK